MAGQREPAPPSNFSKLGGFRNRVFITEGIYGSPPQNFALTEPALILLSFAGSAQARVFGSILLKDLSQLAGGLEKGQLGLLAGEIGVQEGHPFVVFVQAGLLDFLQGDAVLVELGLLR